MQLERTLTSPLSVATVFQYLAQFHRVVEWDASVTRARKLSAGPIGVGTQFEVDVHFLGQTTRLVYTLLEFEPCTRLVLRGTADLYQVVDTIHFASTPSGGTALRYQLSVEYTARLKRIAGIFAPLVRRNVDDAITGLTRTLNDSPQKVEPYPLWRDKFILPGALEFTRWGFRNSKKHWKGLSQDLRGQHILITGASSGLGRAATLALAEMGAHVIAVVRDHAKGAQLQQDVQDYCGATLQLEYADLASLTQTVALAQRLRNRDQPLQVLINNAGALFNTRQLTAEGLEKSFALLLASPFALTELLLPLLRQNDSARVINVVSGGMYTQAVHPQDLNYEQETYDGPKAYARAKRGLVDMTRWWAQQPENRHVIFHAMHPGWADTQAVADSLPGFYRTMQRWLRTPEQGADTIVWLAAAREPLHRNGEFWLDRRPHTTAIFPGTESSAETRLELQQHLHRLLQTFTPIDTAQGQADATTVRE